MSCYFLEVFAGKILFLLVLNLVDIDKRLVVFF